MLALLALFTIQGCTERGPCGEVYADLDHDGYGDLRASAPGCVGDPGVAAVAGDCDDARAEVHPGAQEFCDRLDDDCDGEVDEDGDRTEWFLDADEDGFGGGEATEACFAPEGMVEDDGDCDDADPYVNPDAEEACNEVDDDCDEVVDEGVTDRWYADEDGDGFGGNRSLFACEAPEGYVADTTDCNDFDDETYPGATDEVCDGNDHSCGGDEDDGDADGFLDCAECDDADASVYPGAEERCDGLDDDCDGLVPEDESDLDADGLMTCLGDCDDAAPDVLLGHAEVCDGVDNDCDGDVDEACVTCTIMVPGDEPSIQAAIDGSVDLDVVCVDPGTYVEALDVARDVSLVGLFGADRTVIQGCVDIVGLSSGSVFQGLTVRECSRWGPGVSVQSSDATFSDLFITENIDDTVGAGGLVFAGGAPVLLSSRITDNRSQDISGYGGGLAIDSGAVATVQDVDISGNYAYQFGGGVVVDSALATFDNVRIHDNSTEAMRGGGGVFASDATLYFSNSTVAGNLAGAAIVNPDYYGWGVTYSGDGGGFYLLSSTLSFVNGVIAANSSESGQGGAFYLEDSSIAVTNSVVTGNTAVGGALIWAENGTADFERSDVWQHDGPWFHGIASPLEGENLAVDPQFLDDAYHLALGSPLIDAGDPSILDPDGTHSDIGLFGGPHAGQRDADRDGDWTWWTPGGYDASTSPGLDCDDSDELLNARSGCTYTAPDADGDGYTLWTDCDDADTTVHPGAADPCDGVDADCDGASEADDDGDGWLACEDCEDGEATVNPGAAETFDGFDTDCDGYMPSDERDDDGDGSVADDDCDDADWTRVPDGYEVCNGLDDDCDGDTDEACVTCDVLVPLDEADLQSGIWATGVGETLCLYPGTYTGQFTFDGADIDIIGLGGSDSTTLDGDGGAPVLALVLGESAHISGLTITGGDLGPAMWVDGGTVVLSDLQITANQGGVSVADAGLALVDAEATLQDSWVIGNDNILSGGVEEYGSGGGVYAENSTLSLQNVTIEDNIAGAYGGGIYASGSVVDLRSVWMAGNRVDYLQGGAMYTVDSVVTLENVGMHANAAWACYCGLDDDYETYVIRATNPGLLAVGGSVVVSNSTFADNTSNYVYLSEAGLDVDGATLDVVNTIAIGDYVSVTATSIRSSDVWGRVTTTFAESGADGNVSVDPVLLDDPLHLDTTSPVVDAGDGSLLDPDGSASDMGFHGGPGAGGYDGDGDGWPNWWLPGAYDATTSAGYDCDDADATAWPGSGC